MTHPGCVAIANAKGGVGKTSIVANLAGIAALGGARTLAIDLDPQGNLGADLGYNHQGRGDNGSNLTEAVVHGKPLEPLRDVRPNLDVITGGTELQRIIDGYDQTLASIIKSVSADYNLVVIDCPPGGSALINAALIASRWLVVPVKADHGSLDGLQLMAQRFGPIKQHHNPDLELLGVALFDIASTSTSILRDVVTTLHADLNGQAPVLMPPIRRSERSAYDMRRLGVLAYEYEEQYLKSVAVPLADRIKASRAGTSTTMSKAAPALADDYLRLTSQILQRVAGQPITTSGGTR